jgi:hypothetical protein
MPFFYNALLLMEQTRQIDDINHEKELTKPFGFEP